MRVFRWILAALTVSVGFGAFHANVASATSICPSGYCEIVVPPKSCNRVEVINAKRVNLRSSNNFNEGRNVIGVAARGDVFKLRRCTKKGCKVILQTTEGKVGAWIHHDYVSCTTKKRYQECGLYDVTRSADNPNSSSVSTGWSLTNKDGTFRLTLTPPSGNGHHHHHHANPHHGGPLPYGHLWVSFNISASVH